MKDFAPVPRANALPLAGKMLYTAFVVFTLAGLFTAMVMYGQIVRFASNTTPGELYQHVISHYQGGLTERQLLEVTHFHLFSMPVVLLVLGHLALLTRLPRAAKAWGVGV